ncbi:hypothetical protein FB45DRAFT_1117911, partial [Roridomyces roridus]
MSDPQVVSLGITRYILGGWDLSVSADLLLQGALLAQTILYMSLYKKDTFPLRFFVYGLTCLTTLKTIHGFVIFWYINVKNFMNVFAAADSLNAWWPGQINLAFAALIAFYVQMFFCHRLWVISRNVWVVVPVLVLFVFALIAAFVSVRFISTTGFNNNTWIPIHLGTVLAGDLLLCGSTAFFLLRTSKQVLPETAGMLHVILRLTFQSAAPAAMCAFINIVCSQISSPQVVPGPAALLATLANNSLPKLYALSAMWTLNSRNDIHLAHSHGPTTSS